MSTYQPVRSGLNLFLEDLLKIFGGTSLVARGSAYGIYSGRFVDTISTSQPIITNPFGVDSYVDIGTGRGNRIDLQGGQSYNYLTGRLSDPRLHANTARRLNEALQYRTVNEVGLDQAGKTTTRNQPGVLATLDQLYFGNVTTKADTSFEKSNLALASEQGFNTDGGNKTVLGTDATKKPLATTALKRALS